MSPQKHAAQIANAKLSLGPRTEAGKARSSRNSTRHGFCAEHYRVSAQDRPEFERLYAEMIDALAPEGALEMQLAEAIITDMFRISRIKNVENDIFTQGLFQAKDEILAPAETWSARCKEIALLGVYEQRINRQLTRNKQELEARQAARLAAAQPAQAGGGFVHSPAPETAGSATPNSRAERGGTGFVPAPAPAHAEAGAAGPPLLPTDLSIEGAEVAIAA